MNTPSEEIRAMMETFGLSEVALAEHLGVNGRTVVELLQGRAPITAEIALRLEAVFEITAKTWMNYQRDHELATAEKSVGALIKQTTKSVMK